jgi:hypothetical protein
MVMLIDGVRRATPKAKDPASIPGTPEHTARVNAAWAARYTGGKSPVVTPPSTAASTPASGRTYGATKAAGGGGSGAAGGGGSGSGALNAMARSGANQQKSALQQAIDAALAQKQTNQSKLDSLLGLVGGGLQRGRDTALSGVERDLKTLLDQAFAHYGEQISDLNTGLRDNEASEADSSFGNMANRARERGDLVTAALAQGAGESDVLKAQLQALRNWSANQAEINRGYFDTLTSTNSAITDLNTGTKSAITGYEMDANQRRGGIWSDFHSGMADAYTQLDNLATNNFLLDQEIAANQQNISGQDALLAHIAAGKSADTFVAPATAAGSTRAGAPYTGYSQEAARWAGEAYQSPGVSRATQAWEGQETTSTPLGNSRLQPQADDAGRKPKKPEGATLRKW